VTCVSVSNLCHACLCATCVYLQRVSMCNVCLCATCVYVQCVSCVSTTDLQCVSIFINEAPTTCCARPCESHLCLSISTPHYVCMCMKEHTLCLSRSIKEAYTSCAHLFANPCAHVFTRHTRETWVGTRKRGRHKRCMHKRCIHATPLCDKTHKRVLTSLRRHKDWRLPCTASCAARRTAIPSLTCLSASHH